MEIKVNSGSNNTKDSYECAFCHKRFDSPVERMNHEQKCYESKDKEAEEDYKLLKNRYIDLCQLIRNHNLKYKENVHFTTEHNQLVRDLKDVSNSYDSFSDFCKEFNAAFNRDYF